MLHALLPLVLVAPIAPLQEPIGPEPVAAERGERGLPGAAAGSERWIVTFKARSFDLAAYRAAVRANDADLVAAAVADLEAAVVKDQAGFAAYVGKLGGKVTDRWWIINSCAIEIAPAKLDAIRGHERVIFIEPDQLFEPVGFIRTATNSINHRVDALQTAGIRGKGVSAAIIDTGQDSSYAGGTRPHATYFVNGNIADRTGGGLGGSRLLANILVPGASATWGPDDKHGHGTGVAGIAAGEKWNKLSSSDRGHAPLAGIVGLGISRSSRGSASSTTIANAYQIVARDKVKYAIVATNNSYSGSPSPINATQRALDSVALNANVLPVVAGGNSSSRTTSSQSAANGLAVAAITGAKGTSADKRVATFSSRGPLSGDTQRFYPDVAANGVSTVMPRRDNEASAYVGSGTSMAAPQVCGAATLFRSVDTKASALETKAAILATTEDISKQNTSAPYNSRNAYGVGYLRDDNLIAVAQRKGGSLLASKSLSAAAPKATFVLPVTAGKAYAVAIAWHRHTLTSTSWSNLSLTARQGTTTLATSDTPRNLYEKIVFISKATGAVTLEVANTRLEIASVPFAICAFEVPPPFIPGSFTSFGKACVGTGKVQGVATVIPQAFKTTFANYRTSLPLAWSNHRLQQIFATASVPSAFVANGIAFRHDNSYMGSQSSYWIDLSMKLGYSARTTSTMSTVFSSNISGTMTGVLAKKRISLPSWTSLNRSATTWLVKIPFDRPFVHKTTTGKYLLFDATKYTGARVGTLVTYYIDADNSTARRVSRVYSSSPTAISGVRALGMGAVLGFTRPSTGGAIPILSSSGRPEIGTGFGLRVDQAKAATAAIFMLGLSNTKLGTISLPLDLTAAGAAGCSVFTSQEFSAAALTNASGSASQTLSVPNLKSIIQTNFYVQGIIVDPTANNLGLVFTNGLAGIVGGQP